ncbi:MAG: Zn-dependent hydrolase [Synergistales bacterium]|nr:Zn-dependent hydrolase [Synergistales bacterium]
MAQSVEINGKRLEESLRIMGRIGFVSDEQGISRLALGEAAREARELFVSWLEEENLEVRIDPIGNIFGIRPGRRDGDPVIAGSHLDTVHEGGAFDGALGVLAGLEVIRSLNEGKIETEHPVAVAAFTNEEGVRFQPDMMGSMVMAGKLPLEEALAARDDDGRTVGEELERIGFRGSDSVTPKAYLELHIEQGPVLEDEEKEIGIVEGIQGIAWWRCHFRGKAGHAGTTPIPLRRDALLGAADLCCRIRELAVELGENTVATMGRLAPEPDMVNVIPSRARCTVDMRQYDPELYEEGQKEVRQLVEEIANTHGLEAELEQMADARPVRFPPEVVEMVERHAQERGYSALRLPSGAGHDAQFMHYLCPTAMIFVPSIGGVSHTPVERTSYTDTARGCQVLCDSIVELARGA